MSERHNARWEDMEKGNINLSRLIKHFESFNRSEGKSPRTLEWYTYVLEFQVDPIIRTAVRLK